MKQEAGILIAAVKSGSGKTMITCTMLEAFKKRGYDPCAFKCGPDYIDPMFHRNVLQIPSGNLDTFFSDEDEIRQLYRKKRNGHGIAVVEGVMGYYDGLGGTGKEGSAKHLAEVLSLPVILVIDAHGMGRSIIPLIAGFLQYDTQKRIRGVLLNRISAGFYQTIAPLIREELQIAVVGYFPDRPDLVVESRHLGLKMPEEIADFSDRIRKAVEVLEETVCMEEVLAIAGKAGNPASADDLNPKEPWQEKLCQKRSAAGQQEEQGQEKIKIGVAGDEAFCFYYEENLAMLQDCGLKLVSFSPLHDRHLPDGISGLLLGGGYPELYAGQLEKNISMRQEIRQAVKSGMPVIAECGGFLYLHEAIRTEDGIRYAMCGIIEGEAAYTGRLVRFGYVMIREKTPCFLDGKEIRGHEFHYYDSTANGCDCVAEKPTTGKTWDCIHKSGNQFLGFAHLYYPSNPAFARHFAEEVKKYHLSET